MGFTITAVCTAAAYTYTYTEYGFGLGDFPFTGIVNGANCSLQLGQFTGDAGDYIDIYNVTSAGQYQLEDIHCNINTLLGCNTSFTTYTGLPYQMITLDFVALNSSGSYQATNWSYFILPPVPSQPPEPVVLNLNSANPQIVITTSQYSTEYGAPLTGCVVAAGPNVWFPTTIPSTLSASSSQNTLPYNSYAVYSPSQNSNVTVSMTQMNLSPNVTYDIWLQCYNSNGKTAPSILFNITTPSTLPSPSKSGAEAVRSQIGWLLGAIVAAGVAMVAA